jgi:hypothetical protein
VHNRYRSAFPSGENRSVDQLTDMLRNAGVEVETYIRTSDEIEHFRLVKRAQLAVRPIYSLEDTKALKAQIRSFGPDVVQLHNPYPLISPACTASPVRTACTSATVGCARTAWASGCPGQR